ncbi:unnamed protein product [Protopolystoma xenopodis]|uniref:Uncharacterized protein n=1 Tax=Protopolystoma xenopodis TaxID=117903 RepID=A0A448WXZ6_9PLAT|nr:unnamed protein product [Protopolystoma xenopodis]
MITKENKEISVVASQNEIELGESFEGEKNEVQIELDFLSHHVETAEFGRRTDKKKILRSTDDQRGYPAELKEEPGTTNSRRSLDTLRHSTPVCSVQVDLLGEEKSQMDQKEISLSDKKCLLLHSGSNLPQVSKDLQNSFGLQRNLTEQLAEVQNQRHQHKQSCHLRVQNDQTKIMSGQQISRVQLKKEQQHPRYPRKIHKESKSDTATTHKSGPPINTPTSYSHSTPFSREKPLYSRDEQERLEYIEAQEDENLNFIRDRSSNCLLRVHPMQPHGSRLPTFDSVDSRPHVDKLQLLNTDTAPLISLKLDSIIQAKSAEDSENFMQHLDGYDLAGYNRPTQSCSTKDERERWRRSGAQVFHQGEHRPPKQPQGQPFSVNSVLPKQRSSTLPTLLNAATNATGGASYQLVEKSGRWEPGDICQELGQRGSKTRQACQDRSELYIKSLRNSPKRMALEVQKSGRQGQAQTNQMCRPRISKQERDKATKPGTLCVKYS